MKLSKVLSLIAIGMIALTATASTVAPETKQNSAFVNDNEVITVVADVLFFDGLTYDVKTIYSDVESHVYFFTLVEPSAIFVFVNDTGLKRSKNEIKPNINFAVPVDVGWSNLTERFSPIPFMEKINKDPLIFKEKVSCNLKNNLPRDNC